MDKSEIYARLKEICRGNSLSYLNSKRCLDLIYGEVDCLPHQYLIMALYLGHFLITYKKIEEVINITSTNIQKTVKCVLKQLSEKTLNDDRIKNIYANPVIGSLC